MGIATAPRCEPDGIFIVLRIESKTISLRAFPQLSRDFMGILQIFFLVDLYQHFELQSKKVSVSMQYGAGERSRTSFKVVLLGEGSVGKTSLGRRWAEDRFDQTTG
jgi:hypothetical protein